MPITYKVIKYEGWNLLNYMSHDIISKPVQVSMYVWNRGTSSLSIKELCFVRNEPPVMFGQQWGRGGGAMALRKYLMKFAVHNTNAVISNTEDEMYWAQKKMKKQ
jgi:hypothetical protein